MIFQIVAVFVTDTEFDYVRPEFETKKERTEYLETVARKNLFAIDGAAIEDGDKLLTLSMCCTLYGKNETSDQRLVVAAHRGGRSPLRRAGRKIPGAAGE